MVRELVKDIILDLMPKGSNTLGGIYNRYLESKKKELRDILLAEIRQGDFSNINKDELVGISYRLQRDVLEGVSKQKLRLMVKIMMGQYEDHCLTSDEFNRYANIISSLSEEEMVFLGVVLKHYSQILNSPNYNLDEIRIRCIDNALTELIAGSDTERKDLNTRPKPITHDYIMILQGLIRTSLVNMTESPFSSLDYTYGGTYHTTKNFDKIHKYCMAEFNQKQKTS